MRNIIKDTVEGAVSGAKEVNKGVNDGIDMTAGKSKVGRFAVKAYLKGMGVPLGAVVGAAAGAIGKKDSIGKYIGEEKKKISTSDGYMIRRNNK